MIKGTVNYAFTQVAAGIWKCHPEHLRIARSLYGKAGSQTDFYLSSAEKNKRVKVVNEGYPGAGGQPADGQQVQLDTTPF